MERESPQADEPAVLVARVSGHLMTRQTVDTAVELVVALAAGIVPDSVGAGVSLVDDSGRRLTAAASDPLVWEADQLQYDLDEGPCLVAALDRVVCRVDDTATEPRWRRWCERAAHLGVRASLSVPLLTAGRCLGAVKVYAVEPGAFGEREEHLVGLFAEQAAVLLAEVSSRDDARWFGDRLTAALRDRDAVATAKGVLAERGHVDPDTAFAQLVSLSHRDRAPLRDVARAVVRSTWDDHRDRGVDVVDR